MVLNSEICEYEDWYGEIIFRRSRFRNLSEVKVHCCVSIAAKLPTDEQHPAVKSRREAELTERRALYEWGHEDVYSDLPGYVKASGLDNLPRDVQFTEEASYDLHRARKRALMNLGLVKLFNLFDQWDDFDDYRKVLWDVTPIKQTSLYLDFS